MKRGATSNLARTLLLTVALGALGCQGSIGAGSGGGDSPAPRATGGAQPAGVSQGRTMEPGANPAQPPGGTPTDPTAKPSTAPPPQIADLATAFTCKTTDNGFAPRRLWRLTGDQYRNTLGAFVSGNRRNGPAGSSSPFDLPVASDRFSNLSDSYTMADAELRSAVQLTQDLSNTLAMSYRKDKCGTMAAGPCAQKLALDRGPILLRRPLTDAEAAAYAAIASANAAMLGDDLAVATAAQAMMLSPSAMFRVELGSGTPDATGAVKLSPYEIAEALSYTLLDNVPDNDLWAAAAANALSTSDQILAQVVRLVNLTDDKKKAGMDLLPQQPKVADFFRQYFRYERARQVFKDPKIYPFHDAENLIRDTNDFIHDVLTRASRKDFLKTLLATDIAQVRTQTQTNYGVKDIDRTFLRMTGDFNGVNSYPRQLTGQRMGILTQPAFLTGFSKSDDTDIVRRGRFIAESLLCKQVPDLPIGMVPALPDLGPNATARERQAQHDQGACVACHQLMDPLGLGLEAFDDVGRFRTTDHGKPPNSSGTLTGSGNQDGAYKDFADLITRLSQSSTVRECIVRHSFWYWFGRFDAAQDSCSLAAADAALAKDGGDYWSMLGALFTSRSFLYRSTVTK